MSWSPSPGCSFSHVPLWDFLTDTQWTPLFDDAHFGIMVLLSGTLVSSGVALLVAIPLGTIIAIYLSEFAGFRCAKSPSPSWNCWAACRPSSTATSPCSS
jgi:ABC-type phosphate transport system permease subunit